MVRFWKYVATWLLAMLSAVHVVSVLSTGHSACTCSKSPAKRAPQAGLAQLHVEDRWPLGDVGVASPGAGSKVGLVQFLVNLVVLCQEGACRPDDDGGLAGVVLDHHGGGAVPV